MRTEPGSRFSTLTSTSTDSGRSTATVKPLPSAPDLSGPDEARSNSKPSLSSSSSHTMSSRRGAPTRLKTDEKGNLAR